MRTPPMPGGAPPGRTLGDVESGEVWRWQTTERAVPTQRQPPKKNRNLPTDHQGFPRRKFRKPAASLQGQVETAAKPAL